MVVGLAKWEKCFSPLGLHSHRVLRLLLLILLYVEHFLLCPGSTPNLGQVPHTYLLLGATWFRRGKCVQKIARSAKFFSFCNNSIPNFSSKLKAFHFSKLKDFFLKLKVSENKFTKVCRKMTKKSPEVREEIVGCIRGIQSLHWRPRGRGVVHISRRVTTTKPGVRQGRMPDPEKVLCPVQVLYHCQYPTFLDLNLTEFRTLSF